ncbi:MAG: right-handed parallel beta-helix repeat-containing protein [Gammaproteobacteria bacterium]|nr:right-handed parallel beta-helix repeat-containing protein [Gammaproteobacteria bacterium]
MKLSRLIGSSGIIVTLCTAMPLYAGKLLPTIFNETFSQATDVQNFHTLGTSTWTIANGTYYLTNASSFPDSTAGNANLSLYQATPIKVGEWILDVDATLNTGGKTNDTSIIFDYFDKDNYYFANFSDTTSNNLNGFFKVSNGVQTKLSSFPSTLLVGKKYTLELRMRDGNVKAYAGTTFLSKVAFVPFASSLTGLGSRNGLAQFDNFIVEGQGTILNPVPDPTTDTPTPPPPPIPPTPPVPPKPEGRRVNVANSDQLKAAILDARPGDTITLADGVYTTNGMPSPIPVGGKTYTASFTATVSGTVTQPIYLVGSKNAVIDGGGTGRQYGLYFVNASHWVIKGISVTNASKGFIIDGGKNFVIDGVEVYNIGAEGIHLRAITTDSTIQNCIVHDTGKKNAGYGEGIYVGSANSNWGTYTNGLPDKSDRNQILSNTIYATGAENIDIKEGTSYGVIKGNIFDGAGMTGSFADSWIDMKGNYWNVSDNRGKNGKQDGFQDHGNQLKTNGNWGNFNTFSNNTAEVNGPGYGFWFQNNVTGNIVLCNNVVTNAQSGYSTLPCSN